MCPARGDTHKDREVGQSQNNLKVSVVSPVSVGCRDRLIQEGPQAPINLELEPEGRQEKIGALRGSMELAAKIAAPLIAERARTRGVRGVGGQKHDRPPLWLHVPAHTLDTPRGAKTLGRESPLWADLPEARLLPLSDLGQPLGPALEAGRAGPT